MTEPMFYKDGHRLCRQVQRRGQSPRLDVYNDRRAGLTFPGPNHPGYFCIVGLKDVVTHRDKYPLEILAEARIGGQELLFQALVKHLRMMACSYAYADCSKEFESNTIEFDRYVRKRRAIGIGLYDASDFDGFESGYAGFEAARAPIDEYGRRGLLQVNNKTRLYKEMKALKPEELHESRLWERYPAVNAFNHVIMSYVISPWQKPRRSEHQAIGEGYGG